jgi:hypothetical protein
MSYYIVDLSQLDNTVEFNYDHLIIGKKIKIDQNNSKYYIYYNVSNLQNEIYIKTPKIRLIYSLSNSKYSQLSIPIYPIWKLTTEFINWVVEFEKNINESFSNSKKKEFISIITKKNNIFFLKGFINDNTKITSNCKKNINLSDFVINAEIEIVLKISYIWLNNVKYGLSSNIYQIKYYGSPEQLNIDFIDYDEKPIIDSPSFSPISNNDPNKIEFISDSHTATSNIIPPPPPPPMQQSRPSLIPSKDRVSLIPSLKDLQSALKKLKPIDTNE